MKKTIAMLALVLLSASTALAGRDTRMNVGCGLGSMMFGDKSDDSILFQLSAMSTNHMTYTQMFGITSGTSECDRPSSFVSNDRINEFVVANLDNLAKDIAVGSGESVATLAELMAVPKAQRDAFYKSLQAHFATIFPSPQTEYAHVVDSILLIANQG